jgi:hypothetical protein
LRAAHINKQIVIILLVLAAASFLIGSVSLVYPFGRDQGIYAYIGKLILDGRIDYKYSYNLRPPAIHYTYALGQLLFGQSMFGMRVFDLIWQFATSAALFLIVYRISNRMALGLICSLFYVFLYYRFDYWHTLQTEGFMNLPLSIAVLLLLPRPLDRGSDDSSRPLHVLISGSSFAIAILFKFTILVFLPLLLFLFLYFKQIRSLFIFITGIAAVLLLTVLYYYVNDALHYFFEMQFVQIPLYAGYGFQTETTGFVLMNIVRLLTGSAYSPLIWLTLLALIYTLFNSELNFERLLIFLWAFAAVVSLIIQWRFFLYHFVIVIPPLISGSALFFSTIIRTGEIVPLSSSARWKRFSVYAMSGGIILYILIAGKPYVKNYADLYSYMTGVTTLKDLYINNGVTSDSVFTIAKILQITEVVNNNSLPGEKIYVWGNEPLIYYRSNHDCASRFTSNVPLYWKDRAGPYRIEFLNEMNQNKPSLILVAKRDPMYYLTGLQVTSESMLKEFPEFEGLLKEKYRYIGEVGEFDFYKLNL